MRKIDKRKQTSSNQYKQSKTNLNNPTIVDRSYASTKFGNVLNSTLQNAMSKNNVTVSFRASNKLG